MLFELSNQMENDLINDNVLSKDAVDSLNLIAYAVLSGKHLFFASRKALHKLAQSKQLNDRPRRVFLNLYYNCSELKLVHNFVSIKAILFAETLGITNKGTQKTISIPLDRILNLDLITDTKLLCENLSDSDFYENISKYVLNKINLRCLNLNIRKQGGGGNTISNELKAIIDAQSEFCLCIVDSDKRTPTSNLGTTCRKTNKCALHNDQILYDIIVLPTLEAENLIPFNIIQEIYQHDCNFTTLLKLHDRMFSKYPDALHYYDLKHGIKWKHLKDDQTLFYKYWTPILLDMNIITNTDLENSSSFDNDNYVIKGYNSKLLENFNSYFTDNLHLLLKHLTLDKFLSESWNSIATQIISWCCGSKLKRVF